MNKDMTSGNITQSIVLFIVPLALGNVFQQLYNLADTYILGRFVSSDALAAVGSMSGLIFVFNAIIFGLRSGVSIVTSTHFGEAKHTRVKASIQTGIVALLVIGSVITLISLFGGDMILTWLKTPESIYQDASTYLRIYSIGLFFLFVFNLCNAVFQSLGDSVVPFMILIVSTVVNILLDLTFICVFQLGVAGAAYATIIAEFISALLAAVILSRKLRGMKVEEKAAVFDRSEFRQICHVGLPSILQQGILAIGVLAVQVLINRCGADIVAGYSIGMKIEGIVSMPVVTIGEAISVFTAQNIGAGKPERIPKGVLAAIKINVTLAVCLFVMVLTIGRWEIGLFMEEKNEAVIQAGMGYMISMMIGLLFMGFAHNFNGALRGIKEMKGFLASYLTNIISRVILANVLFYFLGRTGIWISLPTSIFLGMIVAAVCYTNSIKKVISDMDYDMGKGVLETAAGR